MTDQPPVIGVEQRRLSELHELYQDLRDYPLDSETLEKLLVFSAPTLIWFRLPEGQTEPKTLFRIVGTVTYQKLQHEADKVLDELIDD
jgi:hypothetical protein